MERKRNWRDGCTQQKLEQLKCVCVKIGLGAAIIIDTNFWTCEGLRVSWDWFIILTLPN